MVAPGYFTIYMESHSSVVSFLYSSHGKFKIEVLKTVKGGGSLGAFSKLEVVAKVVHRHIYSGLYDTKGIIFLGDVSPFFETGEECAEFAGFTRITPLTYISIQTSEELSQRVEFAAISYLLDLFKQEISYEDMEVLVDRGESLISESWQCAKGYITKKAQIVIDGDYCELYSVDGMLCRYTESTFQEIVKLVDFCGSCTKVEINVLKTSDAEARSFLLRKKLEDSGYKLCRVGIFPKEMEMILRQQMMMVDLRKGTSKLNLLFITETLNNSC